jgi:hypothetical protein
MVFSCLQCLVGYCDGAVEVGLFGTDPLLLSLFPLYHLSSSRSHVGDHGETTRMRPRSWRRMMVVGKLGGALWIVWGGCFLGVGRNPRRLILHRCSDACGFHHSFLKGFGVPFPHPPSRTGETLGLIRIAVALSSHSFLKVLLYTWHFGLIEAWWDFSGGRGGCESSSFSQSISVGICFSCFVLWAWLCCGPSKLVVSCGCYINIAGRKPIS